MNLHYVRCWVKAGALRLLMVLFGCCLALGLLELLARFYLQPYPNTEFIRSDPVFQVSMIPNQEGYYLWGGHNTYVKLNSRGMRDIETTYEKPADTYRILLLGDSFGTGLSVAAEDTFASRLEVLLNQNSCGRRYEVVNASMDGWGTAQEALFFKLEGYKYYPDLVLLDFTVINDVSDNAGYIQSEQGASSNSDVPAPRPSFRNTVNAGLTGLKVWLNQNSHLYVYLNRTLKYSAPPALLRPLVGIGPWFSLTASDTIPDNYFIYSADYSSAWDDAWKETERAIADVTGAASASDAMFAAVIVPTREQVHPARWQETLDAYPAMKNREWDLEKPERLIEEILDRQGVPYLSLLMPFREHGATEDLYFHYDPHFNEVGHKLAAELIHKWLKTSNLLSAQCK